MSTTIVLYASSYGSTRRYAEWIAQDLHCEAKSVDACKKLNFSDYDTVIFGGGLYAGGISGSKFIVKHLEQLADKHVILFTVGLNPTEDVSVFQPTLEKAIPPEALSRFKCFHLRGGMDMARLSMPHRAMIHMLCAMLRKKPEAQRTAQERGMLACCSSPQDFTDRDTIRPLVACAASRP